MAIALIAVVAVMTSVSVSLPAIMAKKHHLTDTQKEDRTASDANGNPCIYGPAHDVCGPQLKTGNINQDCEDKGGDIGLVCDVK